MSVSRAGLSPLVLSLAVLAAAIWGVTASAEAQQAPAAPAANPAAPPASSQPLNVMVVDIQTLMRKSKAAVMVRQQLEQKRTEYAKEMSKQDEALRHESENLQRQAASLSPDALTQKKREFQQKLGEFDRNVQSKRQALEHSDAEASEKIQTVIRDIITEMATEKNVNLVFQSTQLVMFSPGFDVTDAVLQKLDERMPNLAVNVVEQPVANTPAAAAAAAAQPAAASAQPPAAPKKKKSAEPPGSIPQRRQWRTHGSSTGSGRFRLRRWRPSAGRSCGTLPMADGSSAMSHRSRAPVQRT